MTSLDWIDSFLVTAIFEVGGKDAVPELLMVANDVMSDENAEFVVIELDGRVGARMPYSAGSIGSLQVSDGILATPFTIRVVLTGADAEVVLTSDVVELTPDL